MKFLVDWLADATNAAPEERATVADFQVWIGDQNVTMHLEADSSENHITLSLYSLIAGLAHDWWSLFGGRDKELSLRKYRMGYVVPDVRLKFDGAVFEVAAHQWTYRNPDIRFWAGPSEFLVRGEAEAILDGFIEDTLARLRDAGLPDTSAALRWRRVCESRKDAEERAFCEAAGALGLDPYQIDDLAARVVDLSAALFAGESLVEFLAGSRGSPALELVNWVRKAEKLPRYKSRLADLEAIAKAAVDRSPGKEGERGWELGYRRARAFRTVLSLGEGARMRSYRALAERLGASRQFGLAPSVDGIRALRSNKEDGIHIYLRNHGSSAEAKAGEKLAFARAVGDAACFPTPSRSPINELHEAHRQAAGRAFAAEFLAPIGEILAMRNDGRDTQSIAEELSVSTSLVEHQLENAERIEAACL